MAGVDFAARGEKGQRMPADKLKLTIAMCADGGFDLRFKDSVIFDGNNVEVQGAPGVKIDTTIATDQKAIHVYCTSATEICDLAVYAKVDVEQDADFITYWGGCGNYGWWVIDGFEKGVFDEPTGSQRVVKRLHGTSVLDMEKEAKKMHKKGDVAKSQVA
jgi:hypothetical protein